MVAGRGVSLYCEIKGLILNTSSVPSTLYPPLKYFITGNCTVNTEEAAFLTA